MKKGLSLVELAQKIDADSKAKKDLIVPTQQLTLVEEVHHVVSSGKQVRNEALYVAGEGSYAMTDHFHGQMAQRLGIPKRYYDKMRQEAPRLLENNVNHWFREQPEERMIRTQSGTARAFLSNRYHRIDNDQIAEAALSAFADFGDKNPLEIISTQVTEQRLYINARFPALEGAVAVGDPVQMGLTISNSEIGSGRLSVVPMLYRLVCTNGMVRGTAFDGAGMKRSHLGRKVEASEDYSIYRDDTIEADDRALMLKIRDTIGQLSDPDRFMDMIAKLREANAGTEIQNPVKAVEILTNKISATEKEGESILANLLRGDEGLPLNLTRWGAANAVTRLANDVEDFDRSQELMSLGSKVLDLSKKDWEEIALAA